MASFYGWTHDYIMSMSFKDYREYLISIDAIRAKDYEYHRNIAIYGKLTKKGKEKLDRAMKKNYTTLVKGSDQSITPKDQALMIARKMTSGR